MSTINKLGSIKSFIKDDLLQLGSDVINNDTNLLELGLDSLKMMRLINYLEQNMGVEIKDEDITLANLQTINKINDLVSTYA